MISKTEIKKGTEKKSSLYSKPAGLRDEHALEKVKKVNGVVYINDSKSISIKYTSNSVDAISSDIILITGGKDEETDYSFFSLGNISKIKGIVYLGKQSDKIFNYFSKMNLSFAQVTRLEDAVKVSASFARSEQVVLFSPACYCDDEFDNYKTRGMKFRKLIAEL